MEDHDDDDDNSDDGGDNSDGHDDNDNSDDNDIYLQEPNICAAFAETGKKSFQDFCI